MSFSIISSPKRDIDSMQPTAMINSKKWLFQFDTLLSPQQIYIKMPLKIKRIVIVFLLLVSAPYPALSQTPSNTIWKGTATIQIPGLHAFRAGVLQEYPRITSGLMMTLPVEAWFLNSTEFVVVLDQRALGAGLTRAKLQPLIGSWRGISYGSSSYTRMTGRYGARTFRATREKLRNSSWSYIHTAILQGSYSLNLSTLRATGTYTTTLNPSGPDNPAYIGGVPTFSANLTKTTRRPSVEISYAFSDTDGR
jgi:hypothetical protein